MITIKPITGLQTAKTYEEGHELSDDGEYFVEYNSCKLRIVVNIIMRRGCGNSPANNSHDHCLMFASRLIQGGSPTGMVKCCQLSACTMGDTWELI